MRIVNPLLLTDSYKWAHILMYPPKTENVFSTWTPRKAMDGSKHVVVFGGEPSHKLKLMGFQHSRYLLHNPFRGLECLSTIQANW